MRLTCKKLWGNLKHHLASACSVSWQPHFCLVSLVASSTRKGVPGLIVCFTVLLSGGDSVFSGCFHE